MYFSGAAVGAMGFQAPFDILDEPRRDHPNTLNLIKFPEDSMSLHVSELAQEGLSLKTGDIMDITHNPDNTHCSSKRHQILSLKDVFADTGQITELPSTENLMSILLQCQEKKSRRSTTRLHLYIGNHGLEVEPLFGNYLVALYVACENLTFGLQLFQRLAYRSEHSWTSLIQGYIKVGEWKHAFEMFECMQEDGVQPSRFTYMALLTCCPTLAHVSRGHDIHSRIIQEGLEDDAYIGNTLVGMYGRCDLLADAHNVFDKVTNRDVESWNSLLLGYAEKSLINGAFFLLERMPHEGISPTNVTFAYVLKACSSLGDLYKGQIIHSEIVKKGYEREPPIIKSLVNMYSLCRLLSDARAIFDSLPVTDQYLWTILMAAYAEHGFSTEVIELKEQMHLEGLSANSTVFVLGLKACGKSTSILGGQELHSEVIKLGFQECPIVASGLITMYVKCECLEEAWLVFNGLLSRDEVVWTSMITGFSELGFAQEVLGLLRQMQDSVSPDAITFVSALKACGSIAFIDGGREVHVEIVKELLQMSSFVGSALMHMYAECDCLEEVLDVFEEILVRDIVLWNTLIDAYIKCGLYEEALRHMEELAPQGFPLESTTVICGLKACCQLRESNKGKELHSLLVKLGLDGDMFVSSTLLDMYCKCGLLSEAWKVSDGLSVRNVVSWSALISGYVENNKCEEAFKCLEQMQLEHVSPDIITTVWHLKACGNIGATDKGQAVHSYITKVGFFVDSFLGSTLVDFYLKSGLIAEGQEVFRNLQSWDVVSWSALISGYTDLGLPEEALACYHQLQLEGVSPNAVTLFSALKACGSMEAADIGQGIHMEVAKEALESDVYVSNTLIDMYAKCGLLNEAFEVFNELCVMRDVVSWSAIIAGCVEQEDANKALELFAQMKDQGVLPNDVIVSSILQACGDTAAIEIGKRLHAQTFGACELEAMLGTTALDMYGKCGHIFDAQQLFDSMHGKDIVALNALLNSFARCGRNDLLFHYIQETKTRHIEPDATTYLNLLTMCSHQGFVSEGQVFFDAMVTEGGIPPTAKHYDCLVDLLGRAGQLEEAAALLENVPFQPDLCAWITMLGACRRLGNLELGFEAFDLADKGDNVSPAALVLMSDLHAVSELSVWSAGDWDNGVLDVKDL